MMTQADILAENQESLKGVSLISHLAHLNQFSQHQHGSSALSERSERTTSSNDTEAPMARPSGFGAHEFPELRAPAINEQSPIKPSKYFASDSVVNTSKGLRKLIIGGGTFSLVVTIALIIQISIGTLQVPNRIGIVTPEEVCSNIGADMIRKGGNSVDAFIASAACLSVVNPFAAGLGAGGYLVVRDHKRDKSVALNCFFKSSNKLDPEDYRVRPEEGLLGKMSVAVPGELKCLQYVYHNHAKLYWTTLLQPSIKLAREGFKVSKKLAEHLTKLDMKNDILSNPDMANIFLDSNGQLVGEDAEIKNPNLADTLEKLADKERLFYDGGELGDQLLDQLNDKTHDHMTSADLKTYSITQDDFLLKYEYNDFVLLTSSFPSAGPVVKFVMDLMETLSIKIGDFKNPDYYRYLMQAVKAGYSLFNDVADSQFDVSVYQDYEEKLTLGRTFIQKVKQQPNGSVPFPFSKSEVNDNLVINFVTVNDHTDLMVSYVGTLGSSWGSRLMTKAGYMLNNGLNLFTPHNGMNSSNSIMASKRPRGLMAPIITYHSKNPCVSRFCISYNHMGHASDDFALSELVQVLMKLFTDTSTFDTVLSDKRVQYENQDSVCYENGFDTKLLDKLSNVDKFSATNNCTFHSIDLIMKKDHIVYSQADKLRGEDSTVKFNEK